MKKTKYILAQLPFRLSNIIACASLLLLPFTFQSCGNDNDDEISKLAGGSKEETSDHNLRLTYGAGAASYINNASIYAFKTSNKYFHEKLTNVTVDQAGGILSTRMKADTWDLVVLGSVANNQATQGTFQLPNKSVQNGMPDKSLMWTTGVDGAYLKQTPEFFCLPLNGVVITEGTPAMRNGDPKRFVAQVKVTIDELVGFAPLAEVNTAGKSYFQLKLVPSQLKWDRTFHPTTIAPTTGTMYSNFTFTEVGGVLKAGELNFIIPADENATNKLKFTICIPTGSAGATSPYYGKTDENGGREITITPKPNHILHLKIRKFSGEAAGALDIQVEVEPWKTANDQTVEF